MEIQSPFPYFGGKRKVADLIWKRFGRTDNYVEPFFGSGAVLLGRPEPFSTETVNDADGFVSNFWRALALDPDAVAFHADWPVNENDLHARHAWLVSQKQSMQARLEGDPEWFDAKVAGWWVWGMACWIGSGFCSGAGPWQIEEVDGVRQLVHAGNSGQGINRQLVHAGNAGRGINRQLVHAGDAGRGINRKRERLSGFCETGVNARDDLKEYFALLSERLRRVRVCCGDWSRICGPSVTVKHGLTAVFLDPPYADTAERASNLYRVDCERVAHEVRDWAIANGEDSNMRICLAGYEGEHQMPPSWDCARWNAGMGFGGQARDGVTGNGKKERLWFSKNCLASEQPDLFA